MEQTRRYALGPALPVEVRGPREVHALCEGQTFGPAESARVRLTFEAAAAFVELGGARSPVAHELLSWPRDGAQYVEVALHAAACVDCQARGALLLHGAGLHREGAGLLALADSGGGKSTLTTLAHPRYASLSDETLQVTLEPAPTLNATSFRSDSPVAPQSASAPLRAMLLLEKSERPFLEPLSADRALPRVVGQLFRAPGSSWPAALKQVAALLQRVQVFRFGFPKSPAAVELLDAVLARAGS